MCYSNNVVRQFIDCFDNVEEVKSNLRKMLDFTICSPEVDDWSSDERADMIFFCRQAERLFDAIYSSGLPAT
jgi:hypothetical protein